MADSRPPADPAAMWRDMISQWEQKFNSLANQTMGSDEFSRAMNQMMGLSLRMQETLGEAVGRTLTTLNLPTREDLRSLGERLQAVETRLDQMNALLQGLADGKAAPARIMPPRTRRAPRQGAKP